MRQWLVLFKKEAKESLRNFKWIWIPLVFAILGMMQPITYYFLPDILKNFGGLPDGAVMEIPIPTGAQVLAETLGQFSQVGILVLVLAFMGTVASERNSGSNIMVLVKPVSYASYLTAKWLHMCLIGAVSLILGMGLSYYYTYLLIEEVSIISTIQGSLVYLLYLLLVMTLVLLFSSILKSTAVVAFLTIGVVAAMSLITSLLPNIIKVSPSLLVNHSYSFFQTGMSSEHFFLTLFFTIAIIIILLILSIYIFKYKEKAIGTS